MAELQRQLDATEDQLKETAASIKEAKLRTRLQEVSEFNEEARLLQTTAPWNSEIGPSEEIGKQIYKSLEAAVDKEVDNIFGPITGAETVGSGATDTIGELDTFNKWDEWIDDLTITLDPPDGSGRGQPIFINRPGLRNPLVEISNIKPVTLIKGAQITAPLKFIGRLVASPFAGPLGYILGYGLTVGPQVVKNIRNGKSPQRILTDLFLDTALFAVGELVEVITALAFTFILTGGATASTGGTGIVSLPVAAIISIIGAGVTGAVITSRLDTMYLTESNRQKFHDFIFGDN